MSKVISTNEFDIGLAVEEKSNLIIRKDLRILYNYLTKTWTASNIYIFPITKDNSGHSRSFRTEWLDKYNWLTYSSIKEGVFCKICVLFGPKVGGYGGQKLGILKEIPMVKFKDALHDFKKHSQREYHKTAVVQSYEFLKCLKVSNKL